MHVLKRKTLKHHYEKKGMNRVNNFVLTGLKKKQYLYTLNHIWKGMEKIWKDISSLTVLEKARTFVMGQRLTSIL